MAEHEKVNPDLPRLINEAYARFSLLLKDMEAIRAAGGEARVFTSRGHNDALCFECSFNFRLEIPVEDV